MEFIQMTSHEAAAPTWTLAARRYVISGRDDDFNESVAKCNDPLVVNALKLAAAKEQVSSTFSWRTVCMYLTSESRHIEAIALQMVGQRPVIDAECHSLHAMRPEGLEVVRQFCEGNADRCEKAGFADCEGFFALLAATAILEAGRLDQVRAPLDRAITVLRRCVSAGARHCRSVLARAVSTHGHVLLQYRDFGGAIELFKQSLTLHEGGQDSGPLSISPDEANLLTVLGHCFRCLGQYEAASAHFDQAITAWSAIPPGELTHPSFHIAQARLNKAHILSDCELWSEAVRQYNSCAEAFKIMPPSLLVIEALCSTLRGEALARSQCGDFLGARNVFSECLEYQRDLFSKLPARHALQLATTLSFYTKALENAGELEEAVEIADQALAMAQRADIRDQAGLAIGYVAAAHRVRLRVAASKEDTERAVEELLLMGHAGPRNDARSAIGQLCHCLTSGASLPTTLVVALGDDPETTIFGVFTGDSAELFLNQAFSASANHLFKCAALELIEGVGKQITRAASDCAMHAPPQLKALLEGASIGRLLVYGDPYWTSFPWELLPSRGRPLGLRTAIERIPSLRGIVDAREVRRPFTVKRTASVIAPWNVPGLRQLPAAEREAATVAGLLASAGFQVHPDGAPVIGTAATRAAWLRVLAGNPGIIHFAGHATLYEGVEHLVLADGTVTIGASTPENLFREAVVFLNACRAGRPRTYGSRREDLSAKLLEVDAQAVVASVFPLEDAVSEHFCREFYRTMLLEPATAAASLVRAREAVANDQSHPPYAWAKWVLHVSA